MAEFLFFNNLVSTKPLSKLSTCVAEACLCAFSICSLSDPPNSLIRCPIGAGDVSSEALTEFLSFV